MWGGSWHCPLWQWALGRVHSTQLHCQLWAAGSSPGRNLASKRQVERHIVLSICSLKSSQQLLPLQNRGCLNRPIGRCISLISAYWKILRPNQFESDGSSCCHKRSSSKIMNVKDKYQMLWGNVASSAIEMLCKVARLVGPAGWWTVPWGEPPKSVSNSCHSLGGCSGPVLAPLHESPYLFLTAAQWDSLWLFLIHTWRNRGPG